MFNRRGQNVAEYAILIAVVIGAAMAMQTYVKRSLQGRIKDVSDTRKELRPDMKGNTGGGLETLTTFSTGPAQYEPYYQNSTADVKSSRDYKEDISAGYAVDRSAITEETRKGAGSQEEQTASEDQPAI